jgi:hypothetical protein
VVPASLFNLSYPQRSWSENFIFAPAIDFFFLIRTANNYMKVILSCVCIYIYIYRLKYRYVVCFALYF